MLRDESFADLKLLLYDTKMRRFTRHITHVAIPLVFQGPVVFYLKMLCKQCKITLLQYVFD